MSDQIVETDRQCSQCSQVKKLSEYYKSSNHGSGYEAQCKQCRLDYGWRRELRLKYNLTAAEYAGLLFEQNGVCAICKQDCPTGKKLAVDHDHASGTVRGLLCVKCNRAVGLFNDNPEFLQAAVDYLKGVSK